MEKIRTIAIVLGDNDFGNTFRPLLEGLKKIFEYHNGELLTDEVDLIIRQSIMAYYVGYQYCFYPGSYGNPAHKTHAEHLAQTAEYLSGIKILFDEEAEIDIADVDHDGGAWYLELQSGTVSGY